MPKKNKSAPSAKEVGALVQAALSGESGNVLAMLKRGGMAVDAQDSAGNHALGAACCGGHLDLVKQLVEAHGAPLELKNQIGTTPLWLAAGYGHEGVLDFLIGKGAEINEGNTTQDTPMLAAAAKRHTGCVRRLVEAGARHMTVNSGGDSPLSLAVSDSNVAMAEILLAQPGGAILIKRKNNKGVHPMASAAAGGNAELVSLLLKAGGSVADTDSNGATPLALAAFCGATEVVQLLLATAGAALESVDKSGATPLWLAAAAGKDEVLALLLEAGANPHVSSGGHSALEAATRNGFPKCRALLAAVPAALEDAAAAAVAGAGAGACGGEAAAHQPEPQADTDTQVDAVGMAEGGADGGGGDDDDDDVPIPDADFDVGDGEQVFDPARGADFVYK